MAKNNSKNDNKELKKAFLDTFFNPRDQRKAIEHAVRESAKDQRRIMDRYQREIVNKAA